MNPTESESSITWAQCDSCSKWRKLPPNYPLEQLPNNWVCRMNPNKQFASCDVEEEPYNDVERQSVDANLLNNSDKTEISLQKSQSLQTHPKYDTFESKSTYKESDGNIVKSDILSKPIKPDIGNYITSKGCEESLLNLQIPQVLLKPGDVEASDASNPKDYKYYNLDNLLMKVEKIELPHLSDLSKIDISNYPANNYPQNSNIPTNNNGVNVKVQYEECDSLESNDLKKVRAKSKPQDRRKDGVIGNYVVSEKYEDSYNSYSGRTVKPIRFDDYVKTESRNKSVNNLKLRNRKVKGSMKKVKKELLPLSLVNWVQCEGCKKWRQLPSHVNVENLPDNWYCKMNIWDPPKADCGAPEDSEPIPSTNSNASSISLGSNQLSNTPINKNNNNNKKKQKKVEPIPHEHMQEYSNVHYVECPTRDSVAGHPVGDRLVLYSQANTDVSVYKSLGGVAVFSKYPKDLNGDKKRPSSDPMVLSFGCKTDWNLDNVETVVTEKQIENELEKVERERVKFSKNGLSGGFDKLLQLCPNLRGQVAKRKIIPSGWAGNKALFTNICPMKPENGKVHRQVDERETFEKLASWMENSNNIRFGPNSPYANMLLYSALEQVEE